MKHKEQLRDERRIPPGAVFRLIMATYATSLPYIVLFVVVMLIATWFVTTVLFR